MPFLPTLSFGGPDPSAAAAAAAGTASQSPEQLERRLSGRREGVRDNSEGVALPDPQLRLLCLDTGRLPARELEREEEQELAGLTCNIQLYNFSLLYVMWKTKNTCEVVCM